jgi:uncharacterized integral membrane protein
MAKESTSDRKRSGPRVSTAVIILIAAVWFIIVNHGRVRIWLWIPPVTAPMWLVLLLTFVGGLITGFLLRRRRNR